MENRIPILKLGHLLLVSIQVDMHDRMAMALQEDLAQRIADTGARGVLIDISSLELVDSFIGRMLSDIAGIAQRARRRDRRRRDAAGGGDHARRPRAHAARRAHGADRGARHGDAAARRSTTTTTRRGRGSRRQWRLMSRSRCARTRMSCGRATGCGSWRRRPGCGWSTRPSSSPRSSELARNTVIHGGGGHMHAGLVDNGARMGVSATFEDEGPGIPDVQLALSDGFSTGTGLGPRVRRRQAPRRRIRGPGTRRGRDLRARRDMALTAVRLRVDDRSGVAPARRAAEQLADDLGFDERRRGEVAIVVTELATNLVRHGGGGEIVLRVARGETPDGGRHRLRPRRRHPRPGARARGRLLDRPAARGTASARSSGCRGRWTSRRAPTGHGGGRAARRRRRRPGRRRHRARDGGGDGERRRVGLRARRRAG